MIVKNPTGSQITYMFITPNLVLGAGETAELDNSYIENVEFQQSQGSGLIAIVKYEKDYISNTIELWAGRPPTEPTINQKGAMVAANSPSPLNPFVTLHDMTRNGVRLSRFNSSNVQLVGFDSKEIWIDNDRKVIDTAIMLDITSDQALDGDGILTGSIIPKDIIAYAYLSGNGAITGDKLLRASLVTPTFYDDGLYLNTSKDWKLVGWLYVDATSDIINNLLVASNFNAHLDFFDYNPTGTTVGAGAAEETISADFPMKFLLPSGWSVSISGHVAFSVGSPDYVKLKVKLIDTPAVPNLAVDIITAGRDYYIPVNMTEKNNTALPILIQPAVDMSALTETPTCNLDLTRLSYRIIPGLKV